MTSGFSVKSFLILVCCFTACKPTHDRRLLSEQNSSLNKINGVNLEMPRNPIDYVELMNLKKMNVEWVSVIPYAFSLPGKTFVKTGNSGWWGENPEGVIHCVKMAHSGGMKVMLKPHVWVGGGQGWLGDFDFDSEDKWKAWEKEFSNYILSYALIADSLDIEILCIGTEVRKSAANRPEYWRKLIQKVRKIYKGQVTYAANWDNYHNVNFWDDLDYIGIDAYFPFSDEAIPDKMEISQGWKKVASSLGHLSEKYKIPVLLTEYGYKSVEYTNMGHWKYREDTLKTSNKAQAVAYEGLFENIWQEDFVAGGFFWKYHFPHMMSGEYLNRRYTPQGKEAEAIITEWYGK